jgi:hypothetical protein
VKSLTSLALVAAVSVVGCGNPSVVEFTAVPDSVYAPGQVWSFRGPADQARATLTILRIDAPPGLGTVVHVRLDSLDLSETGRTLNGQHEDEHMPFARAALDSSVVRKLVDSGAVSEYRAGYEVWRRAKGGAFSVAVGSFLTMLSQSNAK